MDVWVVLVASCGQAVQLLDLLRQRHARDQCIGTLFRGGSLCVREVWKCRGAQDCDESQAMDHDAPASLRRRAGTWATSNDCSISSSVLPLVSGSRTAEVRTKRTVQPAHT